MIRKIYILLCLWVLGAGVGYAQQDPQYSQYMFDKLVINPAYAGSVGAIEGLLGYRNQFVGFEGSPITSKLTVHAPIQAKYMGVGLKVIHDQLGVTKSTTINGIYSYHIGLAGGKMSFGLEGGIMNYSVAFDQLNLSAQDDDVFNQGALSKIAPDASFGLFYTTDRFYAGVSGFHLIKSKISPVAITRDPVAQMAQHWFFHTGYYIEISDDLGIEPSVLVKTVTAAPMSMDINTNIMWKDMVAAGISYRTGDALAFLVRYKYDDMIVVGYSYDMRISGLAAYTGAAHEVILSYRLKLLPPAREKVVDPRYYF